MDAYLDIETTWQRTISVIGIYRPDAGTVQLVGHGVSDVNLYAALDGITAIYTFNGASFDLPIIAKALHANLKYEYQHYDLLRECRRQNLRGGLKIVEQKIGIARETAGVDGRDALRLWRLYETYGDKDALDLLLRYNRDDVIHLPRLRSYLHKIAEPELHPAITIWRTTNHSLLSPLNW
ncbi:MAG: ribonuclease H-like domain-containing protein [Herpetosiphon sp.]|nr:ribonuclease H-like domain-containing protein [Herpetosiphon sp.]